MVLYDILHLLRVAPGRRYMTAGFEYMLLAQVPAARRVYESDTCKMHDEGRTSESKAFAVAVELDKPDLLI